MKPHTPPPHPTRLRPADGYSPHTEGLTMSYATFHDELSATMVLPEPGPVVFAAGASGSVFKQVMQALLLTLLLLLMHRESS